MNKNPLLSATPGPGARFRNLNAASWRGLLAAIAALLIIPLSLSHAAQSCTLAWDASSDPNIAGYTLRYGTTSASQPIDAGKTTTFTVSNLNDGTTYFFTVSAYNAARAESQPSNQVSYTTPALSPTPTPAPTPSGAFVIGDRVVALQVVAARNVASTAGNILQLHATGELGTVIGGPVSANGWTWWNINYDTGSDGWSTQEGYLALATHTLTVIDGSGDGPYPAGWQVPVSADAPPAGQEFALWTNNDGTLANGILSNPLSSTTMATMPSSDVTIKATYKAVTTTSGDKIRYYPREGHTHRMIGGVFEGTNGDPVIGPYTTIYTITTNPSTDWTEVGVSLGDYRYLRYRGPNGYYGNVAEIEFYRTGVKLNGTGYGTAGSWNNQGTTFDKALDGNVNTFFDAPMASGAYVGIDTGNPATL